MLLLNLIPSLFLGILQSYILTDIDIESEGKWRVKYSFFVFLFVIFLDAVVIGCQ
jgi:hypothetical protein